MEKEIKKDVKFLKCFKKIKNFCQKLDKKKKIWIIFSFFFMFWLIVFWILYSNKIILTDKDKEIISMLYNERWEYVWEKNLLTLEEPNNKVKILLTKKIEDLTNNELKTIRNWLNNPNYCKRV